MLDHGWCMRLHLFDACSKLSTLFVELAHDLFFRSVYNERVWDPFALKQEQETFVCLTLLLGLCWVQMAPAVWSCEMP